VNTRVWRSEVIFSLVSLDGGPSHHYLSKCVYCVQYSQMYLTAELVSEKRIWKKRSFYSWLLQEKKPDGRITCPIFGHVIGQPRRRVFRSWPIRRGILCVRLFFSLEATNTCCWLYLFPLWTAHFLSWIWYNFLCCFIIFHSKPFRQHFNHCIGHVVQRRKVDGENKQKGFSSLLF
jgi:hypothetical protein